MSLKNYRLKRNFRETSEPKPEVQKESGQRFVIQKHDSSRLHYDFRLEMKDEETGDIVLKSWAVPKNVPLEKQKKHLAVQTEDHPVGYEKFEGEIPSGNYGAGKVEIWDSGKWGMMKGSVGGGSLTFNLFGSRVKGRYQMIRTKGLGKNKGKDSGEDNSDEDREEKQHWLIWRRGDEDINF